MKHIAIAALAVAAFGATFVGTRTADATEGWQSSGWKTSIGDYSFSTTSDGYAVNYSVNAWPWPNATVSSNTTGSKVIKGQTNVNCIAQQCPTTHWALTLCNDYSYITGNMVSASSTTATFSATSTTNGYGSGYFFSNGSPESSDPGFCPSSMIAGGVWVYNY